MTRQLTLLCLGLCGAMLILSGCAASSVPSAGKATALPKTASVTRPEKGGSGFVIEETQAYSEALRVEFDRGVAALQGGEYDYAVDAFTVISRDAPLLSAPHINLAIAYIRSDRDKQAEKPLNRALQLVPGHPLASHEYGLLLRRAGRFDEAREIYEESLQFFPEYYPLRKNLGVLCDIYLNDLECAATQFEQFLQVQPDDQDVQIWLAEVKGRLGR